MSRMETSGSSDPRGRIEELLADEAMSELDSAEAGELRAAGVQANPFDDIVCSLSKSLAPPMAMPLDLARRIEQQAAAFVKQPVVQPQQGSMRIGNVAGWIVAAAACLALLLTNLPKKERPPTGQVVVAPVPAPTPAVEPTPAEQREQLAAAPGTLKIPWAGVKDTAAGGDVVWSDKDQRGFMKLANLPVNDPTQYQYQLWIFDETGDMKFPVDGGVFNVSSSGELIIPIDPKVKVGKAVMFAVTRERPGGVPVSKREYISVLAKPA